MFSDPNISYIEKVEIEKGDKQISKKMDSVDRMQIMKDFVGGGFLSASYLKHVYQRFQTVDKDGSGEIDYEEFLQVIEKEDNPVSRRM